MSKHPLCASQLWDRHSATSLLSFSLLTCSPPDSVFSVFNEFERDNKGILVVIVAHVGVINFIYFIDELLSWHQHNILGQINSIFGYQILKNWIR